MNNPVHLAHVLVVALVLAVALPTGAAHADYYHDYGRTESRQAHPQWSPTLSLFIAVGSSGKIATSSDGINWPQQTSGSTQTLGAAAAK